MNRSDLSKIAAFYTRPSLARASPECPWFSAKSLILLRLSPLAYVSPKLARVVAKLLILRRPSVA